MKATLAKVLACICLYAPCTKLCVKTHSGLSMSTVLSAVEELAAEGWVRCEQKSVPQGGKPHAALSIGDRRFWGAYTGDVGPFFASISPLGDIRKEEELPVNTLGVCVGKPVEGLLAVSPPQALCYALSIASPTAVVDGVRLYLPYGDGVDLGELPSPLLGNKRLSYAEAFEVADKEQTGKMRQELSLWIRALCGCDRVVYYGGEKDAAIAAMAAMYCEMYRDQKSLPC